MARKQQDRRSRHEPLHDLDPYLGCPADASIGLEPLAVGWLERREPFATGPVPDAFPEALLSFCADRHVVCATPNTLPCPLCGQRPEPISRGDDTAHMGNAEIRVLGEEDVFAAPTMIYHYVTTHNYQPPPVFIEAVLNGPPPGAPEHRVLVRTLNSAR
jgi:hypothetical protein